jgi:hypothetical protein
VKGAALEDRGLAEAEIVARRSADQRDFAQRVLNGHRQQFLGMRQAIDQKQRDMVDALAQRPAFALGLRGQLAHLRARRDRVEMVDVEKAMRSETKGTGGKADGAQTVMIIAALGQLARAGAADHAHALGLQIDRPGQLCRVEMMRAEQDRPGQFFLPQLRGDLLHRLERVIRMRGCENHPRFHQILHHLPGLSHIFLMVLSWTGKGCLSSKTGARNCAETAKISLRARLSGSVQPCDLLIGEDARTHDKTQALGCLQRHARAAPRHHIDGHLRMAPIFELRGADPHLHAIGNFPQQHVLSADPELALGKAHRRRTVAAAARLVKHQRPVACLQPGDQRIGGLGRKNAWWCLHSQPFLTEKVAGGME